MSFDPAFTEPILQQVHHDRAPAVVDVPLILDPIERQFLDPFGSPRALASIEVVFEETVNFVFAERVFQRRRVTKGAGGAFIQSTTLARPARRRIAPTAIRFALPRSMGKPVGTIVSGGDSEWRTASNSLRRFAPPTPMRWPSICTMN